MKRLRAFWLDDVDLAPLAIFRIVFGLLLFIWFCQLFPDLGAFFTDEGMLPRQSLLALQPGRLSLLNVVGDWWQVFVLWLASLVVALMLAVGYRTRLASILAFLAVISFQGRNPLILDGSDLVYRMAPFWLIFTAAGDRYSVDAAIRRARGDPPSGRGPALPVRLLELQVAWIYLASGVEKLAGAAWLDGTAAYYALQLKHTFGRAYAEPLAFNPLLQRAVSWGTLAVELLFLPLVFFPVLQRQARIVAVAGGVMLHAGILVLLNVGNFPLVMLAALIPFLPADMAHRLVAGGRRLFARSQVRLYYDGACYFCRRTVAYLDALDIYRTVTCIDFRTIDPSQAGLRAEELERRIHAIDDRGRTTSGFAALARASRGIPLLFPLALPQRVPPLARLAERAYDWVAGRRLLLLTCPGDACEAHFPPVSLTPPPTLALPRKGGGDHLSSPATARRLSARPWWARPVAYWLLAIVAVGSFATALPTAFAANRPPEGAYRVLTFASLDQRWDMFSPDPATSDGWLLAPARLADGTELDLLTGGPPSDAPRFATPFYLRWAKVTERIAAAANTHYREEYGRMYCRMRNWHLGPGESPLATFEIYYVERTIQPPGQGDPVLRTHHLWSHAC